MKSLLTSLLLLHCRSTNNQTVDIERSGWYQSGRNSRIRPHFQNAPIGLGTDPNSSWPGSVRHRRSCLQPISYLQVNLISFIFKATKITVTFLKMQIWKTGHNSTQCFKDQTSPRELVTRSGRKAWKRKSDAIGWHRVCQFVSHRQNSQTSYFLQPRGAGRTQQSVRTKFTSVRYFRSFVFDFVSLKTSWISETSSIVIWQVVKLAQSLSRSVTNVMLCACGFATNASRFDTARHCSGIASISSHPRHLPVEQTEPAQLHHLLRLKGDNGDQVFLFLFVLKLETIIVSLFLFFDSLFSNWEFL